jgi:acetolactate synthase-1/3 small subunit
MTIVVNVEALPLEQVTKQLNKLINVIKIVELEPASSVERQLLLVKVKADATTAGRSSRRSSCSVPRPSTSVRTPSRSRSPVTRQARRDPAGAGAVRHPRAVQSGKVAVGRGARSISDRHLRPVSTTG